MSSQPGAKPDTVSSNKRVGSSSLRKYSEEETIFTKQKKKKGEKIILQTCVDELYDLFQAAIRVSAGNWREGEKKNTNKLIKAEIF